MRFVKVAALVALLFLPGLAVQAQEADPWAERIAAKADSVVFIRFVLRIQISMGGQSQENEQNGEVPGVLVDDRGLILTANSHFDPSSRMPRGMRSQVQMKATPTDIKVLFGNEEEEYEAQIVARDSNLGLAFVQITDLGEREVRATNLAAGGTMSLGQELFTVGRMSRAFDCTPVVGRIFVRGKVEKPREMWIVAGDSSPLGLPVFDLEGRAAGVLTLQGGSSGVEGGGGTQRVVLPLPEVLRSLKAAQERAAEATAGDDEENDGEEEDAPEGGNDEEAPEDEPGGEED